MDLLIDREISVAEFGLLKRHVSDCAHCARGLLDTIGMEGLLSSLPDLRPGPEVVSGVMMRLPRGRRKRALRLTAWQMAAAVFLVLLLTGVAYVSGSRQMTAALVEQRDGQTVVVAKPGSPLIIPPGAVLQGDLRVEGDVYLQGRVQGDLDVTGQVSTEQPAGPWRHFRDSVRSFLRNLIGRQAGPQSSS